MWYGIPWWVWVFVIPELAIAALWLVIGLPLTTVFALLQRRRERREERRDSP